jgi:SAM-dependent methyltransferase
MRPPNLTGLVPLWRELTGHTDGPADRLTRAEEAAVARAVHRLSAGFSGDRNIAGQGYLQDAARLGAYLVFFAPISHAQAHAVFRAVSLAPGPSGRALDLGCGPGPVSRALLDLGFDEVHAGDHATEALTVARGLARGARGALHPFFWDGEGDTALPDGPFDVITFGHVLNELSKRAPDRIERRAALLESLSARLSPGGRLIAFEPASHAINADTLALRDEMVARGFTVEAPCFTTGPCPARAAGAACHGELVWSAPEQVRALARAAHLDKSTLAYGWLVLRAPGAPMAARPETRVRVVSERLRNKAGRERFVVCGAQGRFSLSAPPDSSAPWTAAWRALGRGDAVDVVAPEARESGWGLTPTSRLDKV